MATQPISITAQSIIKVILVLLGIWFLYAIRDIVTLLFVAVIIASAVNPIIERFERFNAPRWLTILAVYSIGLSILGIIVWGVLPIIIIQFREFVMNLPSVFNQTVDALHLTEIVDNIDSSSILPDLLRTFADQVIQTPANIFKLGASVFGGILSAFSLFIFSYYILLEHQKIKDYFLLFISKSSRKHVASLIDKGEHKLGEWMRGQLLLMFVVGMLNFIGLSILDVKYAASLGLLAGILEIVPMIGPVIAAIIAAMVALTQSGWHVVAVIALATFIQQAEQYLIIPRIMKSAVGLDPLTVILAIMIGSRVAGTTGALLAIPATVILFIVWDEYKSKAHATSNE